jgi:hypothetical protein
MRLIRLAALLGMTLALIDFCWTAVDAPRAYGLFREKDWHDFKIHLHHVLRDQYPPGSAFTLSAILYVLAGLATRDRQQGGEPPGPHDVFRPV